MDLPTPPMASKHEPLLFQKASGTILTVKPGLNMLRGVAHTTEIHKLGGRCFNNSGSFSAAAIRTELGIDKPQQCAQLHTVASGANSGPNSGHAKGTCGPREEEPEAGAVGEGKGCTYIPHLPSGLTQLRAGALSEEPTQKALGW